MLAVNYLYAQEFDNPNLVSMVQAERNFSKMSQEKSTREAFLYFLNDSSLGFDNSFIPMKPKWEKRQADTSNLWWEPEYVDIAASGDFGISTGPWEYKAGKNSRVGAQGYFFTVWVKQSNNQWKVAIDMGITHPRPVIRKPLSTATNHAQPSVVSGNEKTMIEQKEMEFIELYTKNNTEAYTKFLSNESRVYFQNNLPILKKSKIISKINQLAKLQSFTRKNILVANSGDLAASYGTADIEIITDIDKLIKKAGWVHIWKKSDGNKWELEIEVVAY
jgi:ketosteroid isomerase-like protein